MSTVHVEADGTVAAPPTAVYGYLADYVSHHPRVLPPAFSDFAVEEGGVGTGTVFRYVLTAGGRRRNYRMRVAEPSPGRVLTESDTDSSLVTTFTVSPEGAGSRVRIHTSWKGAGGIGGFFEKRFAPSALRRLYDDELRRLDDYARQQAEVG